MSWLHEKRAYLTSVALGCDDRQIQEYQERGIEWERMEIRKAMLDAERNAAQQAEELFRKAERRRLVALSPAASRRLKEIEEEDLRKSRMFADLAQQGKREGLQ